MTHVDRAKIFYTDQVGIKADHDFQIRPELRFVQLTPPGSACSIVIGQGSPPRPPAPRTGLQVVVEAPRRSARS